ncbi:hypothetical protein BG58_11055 [Caballeronia jiangsuensis]|nr:hypothetical protein BG58_11055 [Caballeronia jiangsuensis]
MRPKPKVLLEKQTGKNHRVLQIFEATELYAVFYDGKPINCRDYNPYLNNGTPKYIRLTYVYKSSAVGCARRLNTKFKTDKFAVYKMQPAELVLPEPPKEAVAASGKKTKRSTSNK